MSRLICHITDLLRCSFYLFSVGEDGPNPTISAGVHKYRFSFKLPDNGLPSSYEGKYGAIRYRIQLQIDRPLFRFNVDRFKTITILDDINVNAPEFCVSYIIQTDVSLTIFIDKCSFVQFRTGAKMLFDTKAFHSARLNDFSTLQNLE